jgi:hypothetical protein
LAALKAMSSVNDDQRLQLEPDGVYEESNGLFNVQTGGNLRQSPAKNSLLASTNNKVSSEIKKKSPVK